MRTISIMYQWDGEAFRPLARFTKACNEEFVVGQVYKLEVENERSSASHRHFFACISEAWGNLPDDTVERFPTPEHLRKHALIKAGYSDSRQVVAASKAEALRLAAFIRPMDEYAIVTATECVVTVFTAKSQTTKAMGRKEFQDSKTKVLEVIAGMIGVTTEALASSSQPS